MPVTTKVVSSNLVNGEVYSIQHYVIRFVTGGWVSPVSSLYKTDRYDITEILLKVAKHHHPNHRPYSSPLLTDKSGQLVVHFILLCQCV